MTDPTGPLEAVAAAVDALVGAEELLEILHMRGTRGIEQESDAGRIADVYRKVQAVKRSLASLELREEWAAIPIDKRLHGPLTLHDTREDAEAYRSGWVPNWGLQRRWVSSWTSGSDER